MRNLLGTVRAADAAVAARAVAVGRGWVRTVAPLVETLTVGTSPRPPSLRLIPSPASSSSAEGQHDPHTIPPALPVRPFPTPHPPLHY